MSVEQNKPKRGRKSKKDLMEALNLGNSSNSSNSSNIELKINDIANKTQSSGIAIDNPKSNPIINDNNKVVIETPSLENVENIEANEIVDDEQMVATNNELASPDKAHPKKRERKPKGGKIIQPPFIVENVNVTKQNIILDLKCSTRDLEKQDDTFGMMDNFNILTTSTLQYDILKDENIEQINLFEDLTNGNIMNGNEINENINLLNTSMDVNINANINNNGNNNINNNGNAMSKDIWKKVKQLEYDMHFNNVNGKKSCCFWDTCEFDNPPIYLPKHFINSKYEVYGCFCCLECAVAYLSNEHINTSTKLERFQLFCHIYLKAYECNRNIIPAPDPYYLLDKYYGNLSIQEYRQLLKSDRIFLVVDKPLTKIMPEILEENNEFLFTKTQNLTSSMLKIKSKQNKTNIISAHFKTASEI